MIHKQCLYCNNEFEGRKNRLYCSEKCRIAAFHNGISKERTDLVTDSASSNKLKKQYTAIDNKPDEPLIPITVMLSPATKKILEDNAMQCGVELSKYISVRSQMDETDIIGREKTIKKLTDELEELKIKLSFYNDRDREEDSAEQSPIGIFVRMSQRQKDFLIKEYIESYDYDNYPNGNISEVLESERKRNPSVLDSIIGEKMIHALFSVIEERFIDDCDIDPDWFEDNPLYESFNRLG